MLASWGFQAAHFVGHSFGAVVIGWLMKMSPSSVVCATLMDPAHFLVMKADVLSKVLFGQPNTCYEMLVRYFSFRELFTVNLLCRNFFWEQSTMWPEDLRVPVVIELAGDDHIVGSIFVRRLLEHEQAARRMRRRSKRQPMQISGSSVDVRRDILAAPPRSHSEEPIDVQWCEGFFHGQILFHQEECENLFSKMRFMVQATYAEAHS